MVAEHERQLQLQRAIVSFMTDEVGMKSDMAVMMAIHSCEGALW